MSAATPSATFDVLRKVTTAVDVLDRLAKTLAVHVSEFFVEPAKGSPPPEPLKSGRRAALQPRRKSPSRTRLS
jgi:hypothetical protein